ncbi:MAG TPA: response regulator, partial [Vicinamibacteria bacterium]|nr:response regulator [Vicinamibacteria bacterium]
MPAERLTTHRPLRVLLVVPEAGLRAHTQEALQGHAVVVAVADATRALASAFESAPDAVVADAGAGDDLARALRADVRTRGVPILMMTARGADGLAEGLGADADEYLLKPVPAAELQARVEAQARRAWSRDE